MKDLRTISEINQKIRDGNVVVMSVEDFKDLCEKESIEAAAEKVDVVTCATFSPTCGVGLIMNLGHTNPPIKFKEAYFNNVRAYTGFTSVDAYIGSDQPNEDDDVGINYSGAHVIEDLLNGKVVDFKAKGFGVNCDSYPREDVEATVTLDTLNNAIFLAHRFCVQHGSGYINSSDKSLGTYKGVVLPNYQNCVYTGTGEINPLTNDPDREIIGIGTRVLVSGAVGYVIGEGTQHNPEAGFASTMLRCQLRDMMPEYLQAVRFRNYATSMYVGLAVPIPILNFKIAKNCAIRDKDLKTVVKDAAEQQVMDSQKAVVAHVTYAELKSGKITIDGKKIKTSSVSNVRKSRELMAMLNEKITRGEFFLTEFVEQLPLTSRNKPLNVINTQREKILV